MISGEKVLSSISALVNMISPYSWANSLRKGLSSMARVHSCWTAWSSGKKLFQNCSSPS